MYQIKTIAIDHGNRNIKTPTFVFPSSFVESEHLPDIGGGTLAYRGKEYVLVDRRMPQKSDKTKDDDYLILTLFAIAKELAGREASSSDLMQTRALEVTLLVGLPPLHCRAFGKKFADYFTALENPVSFSFNGKAMQIRIVDVKVYPQGYAAAVTVLEDIKDFRTVNIIDVGGHTVDFLRLTNLKPDLDVLSTLYMGANKMFQLINEQARAKGASNVPDSTIEGILLNDARVLSGCSRERIELVLSNAEKFAKELISEVAQHGLDLLENRTVFVGGGALMLREQISKTGMVASPYFVSDVKANVKGYQLLYENRKPTEGTA